MYIYVPRVQDMWNTHIYMYIHVFIHVCVCMPSFRYIYVFYTHIYVFHTYVQDMWNTHVYIYIHVFIHVCVCMPSFRYIYVFHTHIYVFHTYVQDLPATACCWTTHIHTNSNPEFLSYAYIRYIFLGKKNTHNSARWTHLDRIVRVLMWFNIYICNPNFSQVSALPHY